MNEPTMTRGVAVWVVISALLSLYLGCGTFFGSVSDGNACGALFSLLFIPILFWLIATIGAGAINVFTVIGQVLGLQVTHSKEIQGED